MYQRILSLNYIELGFLVKQFDPEIVSNFIQSESSDYTNFMNIGVKTYTNFLKVITKKLKFKVNAVYYRDRRCFCKQTFEQIAFNFPNIKIVNH